MGKLAGVLRAYEKTVKKPAKYKGVNAYAICYKMKRDYGWKSHDKWQRCVDKIKAAKSSKRRK
jgi:hypothetical protein